MTRRHPPTPAGTASNESEREDASGQASRGSAPEAASDPGEALHAAVQAAGLEVTAGELPQLLRQLGGRSAVPEAALRRALLDVRRRAWRERLYRPALSLTCCHPSHRPCPGGWGNGSPAMRAGIRGGAGRPIWRSAVVLAAPLGRVRPGPIHRPGDGTSLRAVDASGRPNPRTLLPCLRPPRRHARRRTACR